MTEYTVSENEAGMTLIKYSSRVLNEAPSGLLYKFLRNKNIELNGKKAESRAVLKTGDRVGFFLSEETFNKLHGGGRDSVRDDGPAEKAVISLESSRILYEDQDFLFYDKPAGLRSQSDGSGRISLNDLLLAYIGIDNNSVVRPSVCNRLDTNTSGIVLCGLSAKGLQALNKAIRDRRIRKYYRAVLFGRLEEGRYVSYLNSSSEDNRVQISDSPQNEYKEIITELSVIGSKDELTYAELHLVTGRKHQIRAQMAHLGHPVIGDRKYGGEKTSKKAARQLLHSYRTELPPEILEGMTVFAPLPEDMTKVLNNAGIGGG